MYLFGFIEPNMLANFPLEEFAFIFSDIYRYLRPAAGLFFSALFIGFGYL
jgi:hypothetical protein